MAENFLVDAQAVAEQGVRAGDQEEDVKVIPEGGEHHFLGGELIDEPQIHHIHQDHPQQPDFADHMFDAFEVDQDMMMDAFEDEDNNNLAFLPPPPFHVNNFLHHPQQVNGIPLHRQPNLMWSPATAGLKRPQVEVDEDSSLACSSRMERTNDFPTLRTVVTKMIRVTHVSVLNEVPSVLCRKIYLMKHLHGPHPLNLSFFGFLSER
jgi:hypothetical protein